MLRTSAQKPVIDPGQSEIDKWPEDRLLLEGKIRRLFERTKERVSLVYDKETDKRTKRCVRQVAQAHQQTREETIGMVQKNGLAFYTNGMIDAYIVQANAKQCAVELCEHGTDRSMDAFCEPDIETVLAFLHETHPVSVPTPPVTPQAVRKSPKTVALPSVAEKSLGEPEMERV